MLSQYNVYPTLTPVRVVATSNQSGTYVNGPLNNGVGATFTYASGVLTIDGVTINYGDRVLLAGQSAENQNGVYFCTIQGAVGVPAILVRAADQQNIEQLLLGQSVSVFAGTDGAGSEYVLVEPFPAQMGISNIVFSSTAGADGPLGTAATKAASDNTKSSVASVSGATVANAVAVFADTAGTVKEATTTATLPAGLAVTGGITATTTIGAGTNLTAGSSGTAGTVSSFPATASTGSLALVGVSNSGNTVTTISNAAMGQASVVSIPDPGAATAKFLLDTGSQTLTTGSKLALFKGTGTESSHAVTINQQAGSITTTSLTTAQYASETITLTNSLIATTSVVLVSVNGGTNTTNGMTVTATAGSGSSTIVLTNLNSSALNGTVVIGFAVF